MKHKLKALASLCLALALTLCLTLPAWAAGGERLAKDSRGNVTITELAENTTVTAYKIMSVNWHNDGKEPLYEAPEDPTYKWEESVAEWLESMTQSDSNYSAYKDASGNVTDAFEGMNAEDAAKFYTDLAKEIKKESTTINIAGSPLTVSAAAGNDGTFTASGELAMGGYLVLVEGGTKIYSPVFLTVMPTYNDETSSWEMPDETDPATAAVKQQELTFEKKIVKTTADSGETLLDKDTVAINDLVTFRLTAGVPEYLENAAVKTFKISDNLPEGMTLRDNPSFTVKGYTNDNADGTELSSTTDYTVAQQPDTNMDFTLEFTYDRIKSYSKITVEYSVTMNQNTVVFEGGNNANGTENHAVLTYVKDQLTGTTANLEDTAIVYSYGIQVTKKGESSEEGQDEPLTGAVFTLKKDGTDTTAISFVKADDGSYRVADSTETGDATTELTVGTSDPMKGILKLSGLDVGEYLLTEVQAPAGYNKLSAPISINIQDDTAGTDSGPDGKPEYTDSENSTEVEAADGYVPVTVINTKGFTLPTTGGMGTVLFTAGGVVLMGAGLVLLVVFLRRRRAK